MKSRDYSNATLTIDLSALAANYRFLVDKFSGRHVGAAVKADAYGIGIERAAQTLYAEGCRTFFVANLDEGVELRGILGPGPEIYVFEGLAEGRAEVFSANDLTPVLNHLGQLATWADHVAAISKPLAAALHVDTGMSRLGLPPQELDILLAEPERRTGIDLRLVMSHLICGDEVNNPSNDNQLRAFNRIRDHFPDVEASFANGAGILLGPAYHFDVGRAGLALYGGNPIPSLPNQMSEVIQIKAKIIQVREIDSPGTVGYGATHRVTGPARIATVPVGYADGYPRSLGNKGFAVIDGVRVPVAGRVSMDLITLDVTAVAPDKSAPGCEVDLLGGSVSPVELAEAAGTVDYELLTRLGSRYHRHYVE
jgi:alanine racemase